MKTYLILLVLVFWPFNLFATDHSPLISTDDISGQILGPICSDCKFGWMDSEGGFNEFSLGRTADTWFIDTAAPDKGVKTAVGELSENQRFAIVFDSGNRQFANFAGMPAEFSEGSLVEELQKIIELLRLKISFLELKIVELEK